VTRGPITPRVAVVLVAAVGALLRVPFLTKALSSDEAGFLRVAGQWSPGHSLYGSYWVDRPPLLIGIYQLADLLGGAVPLRLLGIVALLVSTFVAAALARLVTTWEWAPPLVAAAPAVLMSDVLFGATEVDGELLSVPFVLAGVYAVLRALADVDPPSRRRLWWVAGGVLGVGAAGVKQSMVEVFVAAGVGVLWLLVRRTWRPAVEAVAAFAVGAAACGGVILVWASARGTRPGPLFEAVVTFRGQAAEIIRNEASAATHERAMELLLAFVSSAAWLLGLLAVVSAVLWWRRRDGSPPKEPFVPLGWITAALMTWETVGAVGGGSYWLHYLIGTVPGSTLIVAAVARAHLVRIRWIGAVYGCIMAIAIPATIVHHHQTAADQEQQVAAYLRTHAQPGESAVVAFGHANLLEGTGLSDPYVHLWSLPVRVRDPRLVEFTRVLRDERPTWVVVAGPEIDTWAIDAHRANAFLQRHYRDVTEIDGWHLLRARSAPGS